MAADTRIRARRSRIGPDRPLGRPPSSACGGRVDGETGGGRSGPPFRPYGPMRRYCCPPSPSGPNRAIAEAGGQASGRAWRETWVWGPRRDIRFLAATPALPGRECSWPQSLPSERSALAWALEADTSQNPPSRCEKVIFAMAWWNRLVLLACLPGGGRSGVRPSGGGRWRLGCRWRGRAGFRLRLAPGDVGPKGRGEALRPGVGSALARFGVLAAPDILSHAGPYRRSRRPASAPAPRRRPSRPPQPSSRPCWPWRHECANEPLGRSGPTSGGPRCGQGYGAVPAAGHDGADAAAEAPGSVPSGDRVTALGAGDVPDRDAGAVHGGKKALCPPPAGNGFFPNNEGCINE